VEVLTERKIITGSEMHSSTEPSTMCLRVLRRKLTMSEETTPQTPETPEAAAPAVAEPAAAEKPAKAPKAAADGEKPAKAKKEKPPALEDKPFADFINQDYLPALKQTLPKMGLADVDLKFENKKMPVGDANCWQVTGTWLGGKRQFSILFSKEDIQAPKFYCCADNGAKPSLIESFMIDERKVSLDLMLLYTMQRLNGEKWLLRN
jgi:Protein of unknown function (DUF2996)